MYQATADRPAPMSSSRMPTNRSYKRMNSSRVQSEQLAKLERDDVRPRPAEPGPQPSPAQSSATPPPATPSLPAKRALAVHVGLMLAAGIVVVALVWQSSYGGGVRPPQQLASNAIIVAGKSALPVQPAPSTVLVAAAETAPAQTAPRKQPRRRQHG
jgi:hypothetical protein